MALAANEVMLDGYVRNTQRGLALVVTAVAVGATTRGGDLRDADGRLVVVTS